MRNNLSQFHNPEELLDYLKENKLNLPLIRFRQVVTSNPYKRMFALTYGYVDDDVIKVYLTYFLPKDTPNATIHFYNGECNWEIEMANCSIDDYVEIPYETIQNYLPENIMEYIDSCIARERDKIHELKTTKNTKLQKAIDDAKQAFESSYAEKMAIAQSKLDELEKFKQTHNLCNSTN